jgi:hypothetical protein
VYRRLCDSSVCVCFGGFCHVVAAGASTTACPTTASPTTAAPSCSKCKTAKLAPLRLGVVF